MRTFKEIEADAMAAYEANNVEDMSTLVAELSSHSDPSAEALLASMESRMSYMAGDYVRAVERSERSQALAEAIGDDHLLAGAITEAGNVYWQLGDYPRALESYERALALQRGLGAAGEKWVANLECNIGAVYWQSHDLDRAVECFNRGLALHEQIGNQHGIATGMDGLAMIYGRMGEYERALEYAERALQLYQQLGHELTTVHASINIVQVLLYLNDLDRAAAILDELFATGLPQPYIKALCMGLRAQLFRMQGLLDEAHARYLEALELSEQHGLRSEAAEFHLHLRDLAQQRNDFEGYIRHNTEHLRLTEEIRGKESTQKLAMMETQRTIAEERQEREKERALLYGALPAEIADRMIRGEDVSGDKHENAAVLFLDVVGFTTHSSALDPHVTTKLLAEIFHRFDEICTEHNVTKIKTIGDSYMAVGFHEDAAQAVAATAQAMITSSFSWPDGSPVQFRIGLHIGSVVAGVIGTQRLQYDVWGDTVNTASRMESTGEPGREYRCSEANSRGPARLRSQDDEAQRHRATEERSDEEPLFTFTRRGDHRTSKAKAP